MNLLSALPDAVLASLTLAAAAGIDLYLTLVLLAVAPLLGFGAWLPEAFRVGVSSPIPLIMAASFYALEFAAERSRPVRVFWHLPQVVVRPVATLLLTLLLLEGSAPPGGPWPWALLAAGVTALAHDFKTGAGMLGWLHGIETPSGLLLSLAEDVVTVGLVTFALERPAASALVTLSGLLLAWLASPSLLAASRLGRSLAWSRSWGSLTPFQWMDEATLPPAAREIVAAVDRPFGRSLRAAPCAWLVGGRRRSLRRAWLISGADFPLLLARRGRRSPVLEQVELTAGLALEAEPLFVRLRLRKRPLRALVFPRSGPSADVLEVELRKWGAGLGNPPGNRV